VNFLFWVGKEKEKREEAGEVVTPKLVIVK